MGVRCNDQAQPLWGIICFDPLEIMVLPLKKAPYKVSFYLPCTAQKSIIPHNGLPCLIFNAFMIGSPMSLYAHGSIHREPLPPTILIWLNPYEKCRFPLEIMAFPIGKTLLTPSKGPDTTLSQILLTQMSSHKNNIYKVR